MREGIDVTEMRLESRISVFCVLMPKSKSNTTFPPKTLIFSIFGEVKTLNFCPKLVSLGDFTFSLFKLLWSQNLTPFSPPRTPRFSIWGGVKTMNFHQKMVSLGDFTLSLFKLLWSRNLTPLFPPRTPRFSILGGSKLWTFGQKLSV